MTKNKIISVLVSVLYLSCWLGSLQAEKPKPLISKKGDLIFAQDFEDGKVPDQWKGLHGTRWQVALLPFGGYVKFLGDANAASGEDGEAEGARRQRRELGGGQERAQRVREWQRAQQGLERRRHRKHAHHG